MNYINVICYDKIGLTIDEQFHEVQFLIPCSFNYDIGKIKMLSINKINEMYNPKYPFFYSNIIKFKNIITCNIEITKNIIYAELRATEYIYKLKILNISNEPIYYCCLGKEYIRNILEILLSKYEICNKGILKYNYRTLQPNDSINLYNLDMCKVNEIFFQQNNKSYIDYSK